ncbi:MAG: hypothetical protein ACRDVP_10910 [Acidimicrobiales bacterium]
MSTRDISYGIWAAVALVLMLVFVASRLKELGIARLWQLIARLEARRWLYAAAMFGWMFLGWHFFAR